jgi:hypothetical protein
VLNGSECAAAAGHGNVKAPIDRLGYGLGSQRNLVHIDQMLAQRFEIGLVWGLTELSVEPMPSYGFFELMRQRAEALQGQNHPTPPAPVYAIGSLEWQRQQEQAGETDPDLICPAGSAGTRSDFRKLRREPPLPSCRVQIYGAGSQDPPSSQNPRKTWALLTKMLSLKRNSPGH